jgi:hypothetical protein
MSGVGAELKHAIPYKYAETVGCPSRVFNLAIRADI